MILIVIATIFFVLSVLLAYLNVQPEESLDVSGTKEDLHHSAFELDERDKQKTRNVWFIFVAVLVVWLFVSPAFIGENYLFINLAVIPLLTIFIPIIYPLKPLTATSIMLLIYAILYYSLPLSGGVDSDQLPIEAESIFVSLLVAFVNIGSVYWLCYNRRGK